MFAVDGVQLEERAFVREAGRNLSLRLAGYRYTLN